MGQGGGLICTAAQKYTLESGRQLVQSRRARELKNEWRPAHSLLSLVHTLLSGCNWEVEGKREGKNEEEVVCAARLVPTAPTTNTGLLMKRLSGHSIIQVAPVELNGN